MNQSIQFEVENAVANLLSDISGLNVYTTNRTGKKLFPYVTISSSISEQMLGNYTGVYNINVSVNYSDTAVKVSRDNFDAKYCSIFDAFYDETPTLATKIQYEILNTKVFMARISSQSPTIRTEKRAWQRGLSLSIFATPDEFSDGLRYYNFSDSLNSFYIATI